LTTIDVDCESTDWIRSSREIRFTIQLLQTVSSTEPDVALAENNMRNIGLAYIIVTDRGGTTIRAGKGGGGYFELFPWKPLFQGNNF